jgi:hypothetical protein
MWKEDNNNKCGIRATIKTKDKGSARTMIVIDVKNKYNEFIEKYSKKLDLGGFSNLAKSDLNKASRESFQKTGLFGELAHFIYRYGSIEKLESNLDKKLEHYYKSGKGDAGKDDEITFNNKTRYIDVKTSHITDKAKIQYLNLIVPQREMHENMIYICAFAFGKDRENVEEVILSGWCINEDIVERWKYDQSKWCMPVRKLRDMGELEKYLK